MKRMMLTTIMAITCVSTVSANCFWWKKDDHFSQIQSLQYVPADTAVFSAQFEPLPIKAYLNNFSNQHEAKSNSLITSLSELNTPISTFITHIYNQYAQKIANPDQLITHFGLPHDLKYIFYMLGATPVLKLNITQADAFWAMLDAAETKAGLHHETRYIERLPYRAYRISAPGLLQNSELLFAHHNGVLTVTLYFPFATPELLKIAFGLHPVPHSLAESKQLTDIVNTHDLMNDNVFFINHTEIVKALTSSNSNLLAKQFSQLSKQDNQNPFMAFNTPACHQELMSIAANWPRTVAGFTAMSLTNNESLFNAKIVLESKNKPMLLALNKIRGFIPEHIKENIHGVFSLGLGINANHVAEALTTITENFTQLSLTCEPLVTLQDSWFNETPLPNLDTFTQKANNTKGISTTVFDYKIDEDNEGAHLGSLDALFTVSFKNSKALQKLFPDWVTPKKVTDISVPLMLLFPSLNIKPKLIVQGAHLLIYTGPQSQELAHKLPGKRSKSNGILTISVDESIFPLSKPIKILENKANSILTDLMKNQSHIEMLKPKTKVTINFDVNTHGIALNISKHTQQP